MLVKFSCVRRRNLLFCMSVGLVLLRATSGRFATAAFFGASTNKSTFTTRRNMSTDSSEVKQGLLNCPTIPMRDGSKHPAIGFGTYKVGFIPASASSATAGQNKPSGEERTAKECVLDALNLGYRFLECGE